METLGHILPPPSTIPTNPTMSTEILIDKINEVIDVNKVPVRPIEKPNKGDTVNFYNLWEMMAAKMMEISEAKKLATPKIKIPRMGEKFVLPVFLNTMKTELNKMIEALQ
jgi:hypothetical protein